MLIPVRIYVSYKEDYPVTLALIGINLIVFVVMLLSGAFIFLPCPGGSSSAMNAFNTYGLVPKTLEPHAFITHMFIHGGMLHFIFNMLFLWLFGKVIESIFGHQKFLLFYFGGGISAALTHVLICYLTGMGKNVPMIGASGAIAAILGVFVVRYYFVKIEMKWLFFFRLWTFHLKAWIFLILCWFVPQLLFGLITLGAAGGVAYWAHIGGFLFGAVLGLKMNLLKEAKAELLYLKGQSISCQDGQASRFHLQESIKASPKNVKPRLQLAQQNALAGNYDEAAREYVGAFKVLYDSGEIEEALKVYETAFNLRQDQLLLPEDMEFQIATQCVKYAQYELAYLAFQKLHALRPEHPKTEDILAKLLSLCSNKLALYREAYQYFQELQSKFPFSRYIQMLQWEIGKVRKELGIPAQKTPS